MSDPLLLSKLEDLIPVDRANRIGWAKDIWDDRRQVVLLEEGVWLLRKAANELNVPKEELDRLIRPRLV